MYLSLNDLKMHVKIEGEGHPLLVLHGFTGSSVTWAPFFLSWQRSFQVIAPDLIGHGQTHAPKRTERYTMNRAVEDLVSLLDSLGIAKTRLLGYSMGGRLGLAFAASHPERVVSLLLESSSPGLETETERLERVKRDEALADQIVQDGIEAFVEKWGNVPLFSTQSDEIKARLREQRLQNRREGLAGSLRGMGTGAQFSYWDKLDELAFPIRLVVGEWDKKFKRIAADMEKKLGNAEIITVSDAGHAVHVEQPKVFDKIVLEFFNQD